MFAYCLNDGAAIWLQPAIRLSDAQVCAFNLTKGMCDDQNREMSSLSSAKYSVQGWPFLEWQASSRYCAHTWWVGAGLTCHRVCTFCLVWPILSNCTLVSSAKARLCLPVVFHDTNKHSHLCGAFRQKMEPKSSMQQRASSPASWGNIKWNTYAAETGCTIIGPDAYSLWPIYFYLKHLPCMKPSIITTVNRDVFVFI